MAKYTVTIRTLIDNEYDLGMQNYPIWNEDYRPTLNSKILDHYFDNEIGFETPALFKKYLNSKLNEIMPKYNILYNAQSEILTNMLGNVDIVETLTRSTNSIGSSTSNSTSNSKSLFQDTPQGLIPTTSLEEQTWATNLNMANSGINDNTSSNATGSESYTKSVSGNNGNRYKIEILEDVKRNIMNIDLMIINELDDLFMQIF